ncbi:apolipoprotein N-acyltransferase [Sphingobium sp. YR768]|uniref:apolipoprotein N-acyltransferase n=1 Tax=Sphingobium sp. YR768 TaxID=1884365 RepID=UPI0008BEAC09|nr:apolipoprotein N-acyltransferase [Sphingobium sp. YR768]SES18602.1 Apolipoprotein N-acyltransferase [Sphingobium sp. YR768]
MRVLTIHPKRTALLAGLLSATGFAPLNLWPVTLACLAALIFLIEAAPDRRAAFLRGWLFGVGHFTLSLNWIAHAFTFQDSMPHWFGYGAVLLLSLYLAIFPGLATLGTWWLSHTSVLRRKPEPRIERGDMHSGLLLSQEHQGAPFMLLFAALWIATEYLRATLFTGFAWNPLGVTLLPTGAAIAATLIGTYGLSALTILTASALLLAIRRQYRPAAILAAPLLLLALWGQLSPAPAAPTGAPRIRIVQPNIGQDEKYSVEAEYRNFRKLSTLSGQPRPAPRLIFWPEAAIPAYLDMEPDWRGRLAGLLGPGDLLMTGGDKVYFKPIEENGALVNKLTGANNSVWIVTPSATIAGRYSKAHLVPYGEYLPMRNILEPIGLSRLVPGDADFWPGPGPQSLTLPATTGRPALKMGIQICYEIIFSGQIIDAKSRPDFLFNPSNDAWFGSWGPVQHLAQARLRALEEGIPIIRSTPTGVSAIIDARGHVVHALGLNRAGFLDSGLPPALPPTLFARLGNWAPLLLMLALLGAALATRKGKS